MKISILKRKFSSHKLIQLRKMKENFLLFRQTFCPWNARLSLAVAKLVWNSWTLPDFHSFDVWWSVNWIAFISFWQFLWQFHSRNFKIRCNLIVVEVFRWTLKSIFLFMRFLHFFLKEPKSRNCFLKPKKHFFPFHWTRV